MKVKELIVNNCKSYKDQTTLSLDPSFNILVGPNGGGKSNTLDIVTVVLRQYFSHSYRIRRQQDAGTHFLTLEQHSPFSNVAEHLEPFSGQETDPVVIELTVTIEEDDIRGMSLVKENIDALESALRRPYRNYQPRDLDFVREWDVGEVEQIEDLTYRIENHQITLPEGNAPRWFYEYIQHLELFLILEKDIDEALGLSPHVLFFSPYRGATPADLQANLSGTNYYDILRQHFAKTSHDHTSLIQLASLYFAEKRRGMESAAAEEGYAKEWDEDEEVLLVTEYLERLGYSWSLPVVDRNRNIYEILLERDGRSFHISQASSGEKEILNFLFGVFAFRIRGGVVVVDEPELHLHPKWQGLLRDLFVELADSTGNQFVVSTHSPIFLTPETLPNIRRLSKGESGGTQVHELGEDDIEDRKSLIHVVNSHNNERMFFADHVVLVEGPHDRIVFEKIFEHLQDEHDITEIVEILDVHGTGNFDKYVNFLESFGVSVSLIADQDYVTQIRSDETSDFFETGWKKVDSSVLKSKKSKDRETLSEMLEEAIDTEDLDSLEGFWKYVKGRFTRLKPELDEKERKRFLSLLNDLRDDGIYILSKGELERYLPSEFRRLEDTVRLVVDDEFENWISEIEDDEYVRELLEIAKEILQIDDD